MKNKKILVFGAAGFIGTYLIDELLKQKYEVIASDISDIGEEYYKEKNVPYLHVDITNPKDFERLRGYEFDCVIHLAALQPVNFSSAYTPKDYMNINSQGTLNILEFCKNSKSKKIIIKIDNFDTYNYKLQKIL